MHLWSSINQSTKPAASTHMLQSTTADDPVAEPNSQQATQPASVPACGRNYEELAYLQLVSRILTHGEARLDRTQTGTLSLFGHQMRFSLRDNVFPLLTTKRVFFRGVVEELLWFVKGDTNANNLSAKNVRIWEANGSREFLDSRGLGHREVGDLGPVYGFQWRHFGARYTDMHQEYAGQGVDQLRDVIERIKRDPTDRRLVISAWNPPDLPLMALPPCHLLMQFYVHDEGRRLSCQMYQRSCDVGLGMPFNIASYALLTIMMAHVCGLEAGEFVHVTGDTHIYKTHVEALQVQAQREPKPFPKLFIKKKVLDIEDFSVEDFELVGYEPQERIQMKMAV